MSAHGLHHRRAAKALVRRKPTKVQVLEERFSPTAIFPGMTDVPDLPDPFSFPFPDDGGDNNPGLGHGHHQATPTPVVPDPPVFTALSSTPIDPATIVPSTLTTSTSTTTTTTSTPIVVATSTTTSSSVITTTPSSTSSIQPATVFVSVPATPSILSTIASPSASAASTSSGVNTGAVVGGVGAGIVAIAAVGFAVAFFIRRIRKRETDEAARFDASDFRRSAMMLHDPPTHEDTIARGYNQPPPPPSMMEKYQHDPVSASAWGYPQSVYTENTAGHGAHYQYQYQEQHPYGQTFDSTSTPVTATSAQPFITVNNAPYGQNPFSPPFSSSYEQSAAAPVLTRQASNNSLERQNFPGSPEILRKTTITSYPKVTRQPSLKSTNIPADDYVDLNRASVSPFQAAQYAEISRRLNVEPPLLPGTDAVIASPGLVSPAQLYATQQKDLPPAPVTRATSRAHANPAVSPFTDPEPSSPVTPPKDAPYIESVSAPAKALPLVVPTPPPAVAQTEVSRSGTPPTYIPSTLSVQTLHMPARSVDSTSHEEFNFPIPPSPAISYSSRYRVDSLPPMLPEIKVQERSSMSTVSSYIPRSPMIGTGYISGMTDVSGGGVGDMGLQPLSARSDGKFVPVPSPLASSFGVTTPHEEPQGGFSQVQEKHSKDSVVAIASAAPAAPVGSSVAGSKDGKDKRPNTVYDPEDAYGGI